MKLVLLHALPLDGRMWQEITENSATAVVAPDLYPLGDSVEEWASGVLRLAGSGPLVVVGNSVGGSVAIEVARLAPRQVCWMILVGVKAGHRPNPDYRDAAVRMLRSQGMGAAWPAYWGPLVAPTTEPRVAGAMREIAASQDVEDVVRGVRAFHGRRDRSDFMASWVGPVTVVSGEHDPLSGGARAFAETLPRAGFEIIPGAGHYVPMERPHELRIILEGCLAGARSSEE